MSTGSGTSSAVTHSPVGSRPGGWRAAAAVAVACWLSTAASADFPVGGLIGDKYHQLGGASGPLGKATSPERDAPEGRGGKIQTFEHGAIGWSPATGPKSVQALYEKDYDLVFEWGPTDPFNYDAFDISCDRSGTQLGEQVKAGSRTGGVWRKRFPVAGRYRLAFQGVDKVAVGHDHHRQGFSNGLFLDYRVPPAFAPVNGTIVVRLQFEGQPAQEVGRLDLQPELESAWRAEKPKLATLLAGQLNGLKVAKGVSVHDAAPSLPDRLTTHAHAQGSTLALRVQGANDVYFKTTTPDLSVGPLHVGAPGAADPKVRLDFDAFADVEFTATPQQVSWKFDAFGVEHVRERGANVTGWLAFAVGDVVKFVGGPDLRQTIRHNIHSNVKEQSDKLAAKLAGEIKSKLPAAPARALSVEFSVKDGVIFATVHAKRP